jgi:hypothetical protein
VITTDDDYNRQQLQRMTMAMDNNCDEQQWHYKAICVRELYNDGV